MPKTAITQQDWRDGHPNRIPLPSDIYYTRLSNKILKILEKSSLYSSFPNYDSLKVTALFIARWFEDICTGIGFWHTVNEECRRRHGRPIPFYDTESYIEDEPNIQDIQLLLWDMLSILYDEDIINPDIPGIILTASDIFNLIDKEWETADSSEELIDFISNPMVGTDYWVTRNVLEWISMSVYVNLNGIRYYLDEKRRMLTKYKDSEFKDIYLYSQQWEHIFRDRHNLIAFTSSEWLSSVCRKEINIDTELFHQRIYSIKELTSNALILADALSGKMVSVAKESFQQFWLESEKCRPGEMLCCALVRINGIYYQCGMLLSAEEPAFRDSINNENKFRDAQIKQAPMLADKYYKFSQGEHLIFIDGEKQLDKMLNKLDLPIDNPEIIKLKKDLKRYNPELQIAAVPTPKIGVSFITQYLPAIKTPKNPFYDKAFANEHAHALICNPKIISHSAALMLVREGMLPDASFENEISAERGHEMLQQNAEFLVNYYFSKYE